MRIGELAQATGVPAAESAATARLPRPAPPQALSSSAEDCLHQWRTATDGGRPAGTTQT